MMAGKIKLVKCSNQIYDFELKYLEIYIIIMATLLRTAAAKSARIFVNKSLLRQKILQPCCYISTSKKNKDSLTTTSESPTFILSFHFRLKDRPGRLSFSYADLLAFLFSVDKSIGSGCSWGCQKSNFCRSWLPLRPLS
jgi:hypothetical protein